MAQPGAPLDWQQKNDELERAIKLRDQQIRQQEMEIANQPKRPEYQSLLDPKTGLMKEQYQLKDDLKADTRGIEALRSRALGSGPSEAANRLTDVQRLEEAGLRDRFGNQSANAAAQARSSLASRQGLSAGASERLARQNMRDQMMGNQGIAQQGALSRANIGAQDEQQRLGILQQLPGMELQQLQPALANKRIQETNINNALAENKATNAQGQASYEEQMKAFAANKQAEAIRNSGGGGGKK